MRSHRHARAAALGLALSVVPVLAGCGSSAPRSPSPEAALRQLRTQLAVLRAPVAKPDRPPSGSLIEGLTDLRRIGPRKVDGVGFWLYVDTITGQVCGESDTDPPTRWEWWPICATSAGLDDPRQFRVAPSDRHRDEVTFGLARDRRGCAQLRLEDGTIRRIPIVRNGWARRTPKDNPVVSVTATRIGCAEARRRAAGNPSASVGVRRAPASPFRRSAPAR